jgi:hypothetical protein
MFLVLVVSEGIIGMGEVGEKSGVRGRRTDDEV